MSAWKRPSRSLKGFLLFELMVAVVVLAISLTVLSRSFISSLTALRTSAHFLAGSLFLEKKMWELEGKASSSFGRDEGTEEVFGKTFRWSVEMKETEVPSLAETEVAVRWTSGTREEGLRVTTYLPKANEEE